MKLAIVILAMVGVAMACETKRAKDEFESFRRRYRKAYKDTVEENYRCTVFAANLDKVDNHNMRHARGLESYTIGINEFSDLTNQEFISTHTGLRPDFADEGLKSGYKPRVREYNPNVKAPLSKDWHADGYVTPIKNQGACGSCWSFTTVAVLESRALIHYHQKHGNHDLSEQHFIECSSAYGNQKCQGGLMTNTYNYMIKEVHGSQKELNYPYISANGDNGTHCKYNDHKDHVDIRITGFVEVAKDDAALEQAISEGPVAVGVNANTWQNYAGGIFNPSGLLGCGSILLNHAVLAVGYTQDYWIIKNSWGTSWGENGYIRLSRKTKNMCGINKMASYPLIA